MPPSSRHVSEPIRLGPIWYVVLGLCTGPLAYAYKAGNGLAVAGFAALCLCWYVSGRTGLALIRTRYALAGILLAAEHMQRDIQAMQAARLAAPPTDAAT